jgi:hypothetical protein
MPNDLKPNKNPRQKGLTGGRPNIVKYPENESNENREIEKIKTLDKMLNGGMLKKPKKAFMGLAVEAVKKSPMGLIGVGADKILKKSGNAGEDLKSKTTGAEQTKQITAKRMGGMVRGGRAEIKGTRPAKLS